MAVERRNPLPVGTYYVDVFGKDEAQFNAWLGKYRDRVFVLRTEQHVDQEPAWNWVLFRVSTPVPWQGPGLPTISKGEQNSGETVQREDPPKPVDEQIKEAVKDAGSAITGVVTIVGLGFAGWLLSRILK